MPERWHLDWEHYNKAWNGESVVVEDAIVSVGRAGDSSDASFTVSYSPARDECGVIQGVLVTAFETSMLAAAQRQARAAVRVKADFLAVMSHELRTPLNAIGGYAELLQLGVRGPVTPEQRGDLERIHSLSAVLWSGIRSGRRRSSCEGAAPPPASRCAPTARIQQVILNLLTNAIKFTDPAGVISVSCVEVDSERIEISISDTGHGIASSDLACVFQPFVQVDAKLTRAQDGTGLGLAISRQMAHGMGGDLTVVSEVGTGSRFTLSLASGRSKRRTLD